MAINTSQSLLLQDAVRQLAHQLDDAEHGGKGVLINQFIDAYAISKNKLYRELKKVGWSSCRKKRADAGSSSQDEDALKDLAAMLYEGLRLNGKATMDITNARSILAQNGRQFDVTNAQLAKLLRDMNMDIAKQKRATAAQSLVSLHPNHVHLADPSLCLIYYAPNGQQKVLRDDEIYKNKPNWVNSVGKLKCWRYVLADHYSGTITVRYYQAAGETQANMYDFLLHCWAKKSEANPFHGVPKILYVDKGSSKGAAFNNALKSLGVRLEAHAAGNARATGGVEVAQNIVEKSFESRLKYEPVRSVEELNERAEWWNVAYNANAIPDYDSRIKRRGLKQASARFGIWQTIRKMHLNILPDITVCKWLLTNDPVKKPVSQHLEISFKHPADKRTSLWDLSHIPAIYPEQVLTVQPLIHATERKILIDVTNYKGETITHTAEKCKFDEISGLKLGGPVIGEEFKQLPDSALDVNRKELDQRAYPEADAQTIKKLRKKASAPLGGLNALSHLQHVNPPAYMNKPGTEMDVPNRVDVVEKKLSVIEAIKRLINAHGISMNKERNQMIREWYPDGIPEDDLPAIAKRLQRGELREGMKIIGGK